MKKLSNRLNESFVTESKMDSWFNEFSKADDKKAISMLKDKYGETDIAGEDFYPGTSKAAEKANDRFVKLEDKGFLTQQDPDDFWYDLTKKAKKLNESFIGESKMDTFYKNFIKANDKDAVLLLKKEYGVKDIAGEDFYPGISKLASKANDRFAELDKKGYIIQIDDEFFYDITLNGKRLIESVNEEEDDVEESVNESAEKFAMVMVGGSIGENRPSSAAEYKGKTLEPTVKTYDDKKAAQKAAKERTKSSFSEGERKHYGLKYVVVGIDSKNTVV